MDDFPPPLPLDPPLDVPITLPVEPNPSPTASFDPGVQLPEVLAYTGSEWVLVAAFACALAAIGLAFLAAASWSRRPRYKRK